jgi:hypothetical protein
MNDEVQIPGKWFQMVFRSPKAERVERVLATLRVAEIPVILEEEDPGGVVHVLAQETPLGAAGLWAIFVPEASLRLARRTLRKLPFPIRTDRDRAGSRPGDAARRGQVALWTTILMASILALAVAVGVWRGNLNVSREDLLTGALAAGGMAVAIGLPIYLACRDAARWVKSGRRRFVAAARPRDGALGADDAPLRAGSP